MKGAGEEMSADVINLVSHPLCRSPRFWDVLGSDGNIS